MGDGKTVSSPLFDDLGGPTSITLQSRSQARTSDEPGKTTSPSGGPSESAQAAPVPTPDERLRAAGFRKRGGAWRR
jgi:hypothetical protein